MAARTDKVIISCAVTGAIHTPTMSEALPITPDQIASQAIAAAEAWRRHPAPARPQSPGRRADRRSCGVHAVPAAHQAGDRRRGQHHHRWIADHGRWRSARGRDELLAGNVLAEHGLDELRSLSHGRALQDLEAPMEESRICSAPPRPSSAHLREHREDLEADGEGHGTKFEHECYDGGISTISPTASTGWFKPPIFLQLIFGILGGIAHTESPVHETHRRSCSARTHQWLVPGQDVSRCRSPPRR